MTTFFEVISDMGVASECIMKRLNKMVIIVQTTFHIYFIQRMSFHSDKYFDIVFYLRLIQSIISHH